MEYPKAISPSQNDYTLESTELDFLNTFESMGDDDTPMLQRGDITDEEMSPESFVTSLPTPKFENEKLDDSCFIVKINELDERQIIDCPGAPVINDCSTFNDGSAGDFDFLEVDGDDNPTATQEANQGDSFSFAELETLPTAVKMDYVQRWRSSLDDETPYLTAGNDEDAHDIVTGTKRTRSIALSDDVGDRPEFRPFCTLGLYPSRQHPPD